MSRSSGTAHPSIARSSSGHVTRDILREAKALIERRVEDPDISPIFIAQTLDVSLRTLHRSFSTSGHSVMSFVRRCRLQRAHEDLIDSGEADKVSEIAARWFFSDASHFIRNFKSIYGETPAAYLRDLEGSRIP
ncbi:helix-turn-helix domain-containing protein [Streptomyces tauricus]|uniref:helix-turn-helix domain-containing protein n=1 Tax=Streptomyces tauricus TaxID=68274 RepID=UPI002244CD19|nr:helix-turn-helix domain-containing protein [Streptomyces tauricus]MCW8103634.1 helix-turn-helix domain-containing protein [Streptomyces tauricus]